MASISDDKLKITIYPGRQQDVTAGLYLDMDNDMRQLAQKTLSGFSTLRNNFLQIGRLNRVLELLQGMLVEQLIERVVFQGQIHYPDRRTGQRPQYRA